MCVVSAMSVFACGWPVGLSPTDSHNKLQQYTGSVLAANTLRVYTPCRMVVLGSQVVATVYTMMAGAGDHHRRAHYGIIKEIHERLSYSRFLLYGWTTLLSTAYQNKCKTTNSLERH
ncbi:hypothetical protein LZ30DRAFT_470601 [Colletotrichum cereale]|nr:hypothetical protein LZ30DRAFT_470601 [Colletotrichum cereale]